jgi:hypothetical protein
MSRSCTGLFPSSSRHIWEAAKHVVLVRDGCLSGSGGEKKMARNERASKSVSTLAGKVLAGTKKPTAAKVRRLAASVLPQAPDRKPSKQT